MVITNRFKFNFLLLLVLIFSVTHANLLYSAESAGAGSGGTGDGQSMRGVKRKAPAVKDKNKADDESTICYSDPDSGSATGHRAKVLKECTDAVHYTFDSVESMRVTLPRAIADHLISRDSFIAETERVGRIHAIYSAQTRKYIVVTGRGLLAGRIKSAAISDGDSAVMRFDGCVKHCLACLRNLENFKQAAIVGRINGVSMVTKTTGDGSVVAEFGGRKLTWSPESKS